MKKLLLLFFLVPFVLNSQILEEGFDDITALTNWTQINLSNPEGSTGWFQGNGDVFPAHSGDATSYIGANFNNTANGTISNWLITPPVNLVDGNIISFYTRIPVPDPTEYPDRLELRISTEGITGLLPVDESDVGDFTMLALVVNPDLITGVYPQDWTEFTYTVEGIPTSTSCQIAFRYYVTDGGPSGTNSNYIGIDTFSVTMGSASVEDLQSFDFSFYPNPVNDVLNLKANSTIDQVEILNLLGQKVFVDTPNSLQKSVDFSDLQSGIYLVKVAIDGSEGTFKIVKK